MRILQVHNAYRLSGGEDAVVNTEASLLRQAGHDVTQYIVRNPQGSLAAGSALALSPWNPVARAAVGRAAAGGFDVAHVHNTWYSLSPSVFSALKKSGLRVVLTTHNYRLACSNALLTRDNRTCTVCVGSAPWPGVRFRCYRGSLVGSTAAAATISINRTIDTWNRSVDLFLAPTPYMAEILEKSGIDHDRIVVKPHVTIDPNASRLPPSHSDRVIFVGRLSPEKGLHLLLSSWRRLAGKRLRLTVIGDGPLEHSLRAAHSDVEFLGRLKHIEVQAVMRHARALVFPSISPESFGLVVAEAMSFGLPVAANRDLPIIDLLGEKAGVLALEKSSDAWLDGLEQLADDLLVDDLGRLARQTYLERFSPGVGLPILEKCLRGPSPPEDP